MPLQATVKAKNSSSLRPSGRHLHKDYPQILLQTRAIVCMEITPLGRAHLAELKRQGFKGYFSIEYEHGSLDDLAKNLPLCVKFFDETCAELAK